MTHDELVERAVKWLKYNARVPVVGGKDQCAKCDYRYSREFDSCPHCGSFVIKKLTRKTSCSVVLSEMHRSGESPDAIGWINSGAATILIECKASIEDYYSDSRKSFRKKPSQGMGYFRYYMTPKGMITDRMKLRENWGLLEVKGTRVFLKQRPIAFTERNLRAETFMLYSAVRRLQFADGEADHSYVKPIK